MHTICLRGRQLRNGDKEEVAKHLCASRSVPVAVAFTLFCVLGAAASLYARRIGPHRTGEGASLLARGIALIILFQLFVVFKCVRERVVIGIVGLRLLAGMLPVALLPHLDPASLPVHQIAFALWIVGILISASMLVSALQRPST